MSSESDFAYSLKYNTHFIVQNTCSDRNKTIKIFNYPINYGDTRDLLQIPGIEESDIRASLLKGVLRHKLLNGDIALVSSNIDLLQFSTKQRVFLQSFGFNEGVVSTSANDTSAGTGAQKVTINYLDTSFVLHSETVTLNGLTAVNTVGTNIAYIESMVVSQVGTGGGNAGTIELFTTTAGGGSIWASIAISDNQTFWAHHYVPSGVTCYVLGITGGATVVAGQTNLEHSGNPSSTNIPQLQIGDTIIHVAAGTWDHDYDVPLVIPGPDLVWVVERPVASTASTAVGSFDYVQF